MNCEQAKNKLGDFVTGRLEESVAAAVSEHLQHCESCRRFRAEIEELYQVEVPPGEPAVPAVALGTPIPVDEPPLRWQSLRPLTQLAAGVLFLLLLGVLAILTLTKNDEWAPLTLTAMALELPELPAGYPDAFWVESREEAMRLARFTGGWVLEGYIHPQCPRCIAMQRKFEAATDGADLTGYVGFRQTIDDAAPDWIREVIEEKNIPYQLPAIRVTTVDGSNASRPIFAMSSWGTLQELLAEWRAQQPPSSKSGLGRARFEQVLECLRKLPEMVLAGDYGRAVAELDPIIALEREHRTAFVDTARELRESIRSHVDAEVARILLLHDGDRTERLQAKDLARRLLPRLSGLTAAERLETLLAH